MNTMSYASGYGGNSNPDDIIVIGAEDVRSLLEGAELKLLDIVANVYKSHARGESSLPHSLFLRFRGNEKDRIIALPAHLDADALQSAGIKWIASFPGNIERGLDRASAVLILNSMVTGRSKAIMEGSLISSGRTAAGAALAARVLTDGGISSAGIVGCGVINLEIVRFLHVVFPELRKLTVYDLNDSRAHQYKQACESRYPGIRVIVASNISEALKSSGLISFATTAKSPHVHDLNMCVPGTVILNISLRDIAPEVILASDNVVDDIDHVCRAETSAHLAEQKSGSRSFIRGTLGDILNGNCAARRDAHGTVIFSPFGLGILDIAVGEYVLEQALSKHMGFLVPSFFPHSWKRAAAAV